MKAWTAWSLVRPLLVVVALLAGCLAGEGPSMHAPDPPAEPGEDLPLQAEAPQHVVGTAWTYVGYELYNSDQEFTVVVARTEDGYLFAGGSQDDLVYHALWRSPWYGERGPDMDAADGDNILDFPIVDGKSWDWRPERPVTARAAPVQTPLGPTPGFVVEGEGIRYEYAPLLGQITRWERFYAGHMAESLNMTRVADNVEPVWYEPGELVVVPDPHEPAAFDVAGHDSVIVSVGGHSGARGVLVEPDGQRHVVEMAADHETWHNLLLPADDGTWHAAIAGKPSAEPVASQDLPVGWAYMHAMPVRWTAG